MTPKTGRVIVGSALIAGSFLVYLAYPVILLALPFSAGIKVGITAAASVLSWSAFSVGIFLSGPEGYQQLKAFWRGIAPGRQQGLTEQTSHASKTRT
jgi:hypothetical protein